MNTWEYANLTSIAVASPDGCHRSDNIRRRGRRPGAEEPLELRGCRPRATGYAERAPRCRIACTTARHGARCPG